MEYKKKNILIVIPNLGRGGAQQVFRDQLSFFAERHNTIGCVFNWDDTFKEDQQDNIISLDVPAGKHVLSKIYFFFKRIVALRRIKKKYNIDFSISHLEGADYVNLFSKRKDKIICWIHGTKAFDKEIDGPIGSLRKKILIPITYRLVNKIITVSEGIRQELIHIFKIPPGRIETIHNSFALEEITRKANLEIVPEIQEVLDEKIVLITHCRLSRPKNLFALIDVYCAIKNRSNIKLMILGDGDLREALLVYCQDRKLKVYTVWDRNATSNVKDSDIFFLGYERNPYPFLRRAALYIMTSMWEGFPLALCEAMACGIPVIAADCYTGPREIIAPELMTAQPIQEPVVAVGTLMPLATDASIRCWAATIESILSNADLRKQFITRGKERILRFDRKAISLQWLSILK